MNTSRAYELGYAAGLAGDTRTAPFDRDQYANAWHEGFADGQAAQPKEGPDD